MATSIHFFYQMLKITQCEQSHIGGAETEENELI